MTEANESGAHIYLLHVGKEYRLGHVDYVAVRDLEKLGSEIGAHVKHSGFSLETADPEREGRVCLAVASNGSLYREEDGTEYRTVDRTVLDLRMAN